MPDTSLPFVLMETDVSRFLLVEIEGYRIYAENESALAKMREALRQGEAISWNSSTVNTMMQYGKQLNQNSTISIIAFDKQYVAPNLTGMCIARVDGTMEIHLGTLKNCKVSAMVHELAHACMDLGHATDRSADLFIKHAEDAKRMREGYCLDYQNHTQNRLSYDKPRKEIARILFKAPMGYSAERFTAERIAHGLQALACSEQLCEEIAPNFTRVLKMHVQSEISRKTASLLSIPVKAKPVFYPQPASPRITALFQHSVQQAHTPGRTFPFTGRQVFNFCDKTLRFLAHTTAWLHARQRHEYLKEHGWLVHNSAAAVMAVTDVTAKLSVWSRLYAANPAAATLLAAATLFAYTPDQDAAFKASWNRLKPEDFNQLTPKQADENLIHFGNPWGPCHGVKAETLQQMGPEALMLTHDFAESWLLEKGLRAVGNSVNFIMEKITHGIDATATSLLSLDTSYQKTWELITPDDFVQMTQEEADQHLIHHGSPWAIKPEKLAELGPQAMLLNPEHQEAAFWISGAKALSAFVQSGIDAIAAIPDRCEAARSSLEPLDFNQPSKEQAEFNLIHHGNPWGPCAGIREDKLRDLGPEALLLVHDGNEAWFWIKGAQTIAHWVQSAQETLFGGGKPSPQPVLTENPRATWQALGNLNKLARDLPAPRMNNRVDSKRDILSETLSPPAHQATMPSSSSSMDSILASSDQISTQPHYDFKYVSDLREKIRKNCNPKSTLKEQQRGVMPNPKNPASNVHFHLDFSANNEGFSIVGGVTVTGFKLSSLAILGGAAVLGGIILGVSWYNQRKRFKKEMRRIKKQCRFVGEEMQETQHIFNEACKALKALLDAPDDAPNKAELLGRAQQALARADLHSDEMLKKYISLAYDKHVKLDVAKTANLSLHDLEKLLASNVPLPPHIREKLVDFMNRNHDHFVDHGDGKGPTISQTSHSIHAPRKQTREYIKQFLPDLKNMGEGVDVMLTQLGLYEAHQDLQGLAGQLNQKHDDYINGKIHSKDLQKETNIYVKKLQEIIDKYKHLRDQLPADHKDRLFYENLIADSKNKQGTAKDLLQYTCKMVITNRSVGTVNRASGEFDEALQQYQNNTMLLEDLQSVAEAYRHSLDDCIQSHQHLLACMAEGDENRVHVEAQIAAGQQARSQVDDKVNLVTEIIAYNTKNALFHEAFIELSTRFKDELVEDSHFQQQFEQMAGQFNADILPVVTAILANPQCSETLRTKMKDVGTIVPHRDDMLGQVIASILAGITPAITQDELQVIHGKASDLAGLVQDNDKYSKIMMALAQTVLGESRPDMAIQTMNTLLTRDPLNQDAKVLLRYFEAKTGAETLSLQASFTELEQLANPEQRIYYMRDCLVLLDAGANQYSQVAISLALPGATDKLPTEQWLALHVQRGLHIASLQEEKEALQAFQHELDAESSPERKRELAEKINPQRVDLLEKQLISHDLLHSHDARYIAQQIYNIQTEDNRRQLEVLGYGHLAADFLLTAFDDQIKTHLDLNKRQRKLVSQSLAHITSLVNMRISENIARDYNPGKYLQETAGFNSEQSDAFVSMLQIDNQNDFLHAAHSYLNRFNHVVISAKLLTTLTDIYLERCYKIANTHLSMEAWMEQASFAKGLHQVNTIVHHATNIFTGTQMLLSLYQLATERTDVFSLTRKVTTVFFNLPYIHQFIDSMMNGNGKQVSEDRLYIFYKLLMEHFYGGKWQQLFYMHEDSILHGILEGLQRGKYFKAAQTLYDKLPVIQNIWFAIRALYAVYQAASGVEQQRVEIILGNLKQQFAEIAAMLDKASSQDEKLATYQKAASMYADLKYQIRHLTLQHADLNPLHAWALYCQRLYDGSLEIIPHREKGNGLFEAVSHYVDQSADSLAAETEAFMAANALATSKENAPADYLKVLALTKMLGRPVYIIYQKSGLDLSAERPDSTPFSEPVFVQYDEENQRYNAVMLRNELYFVQQQARKLALHTVAQPSQGAAKQVTPAELILPLDAKARLAAARERVEKLRQAPVTSTVSEERKAVIRGELRHLRPSFFAKGGKNRPMTEDQPKPAAP